MVSVLPLVVSTNDSVITLAVLAEESLTKPGMGAWLVFHPLFSTSSTLYMFYSHEHIWLLTRVYSMLLVMKILSAYGTSASIMKYRDLKYCNWRILRLSCLYKLKVHTLCSLVLTCEPEDLVASSIEITKAGPRAVCPFSSSLLWQ